MSFIFTADWHLKEHSDRAHDENGVPLKLVETFGAIHQMCEYAVKHNISNIKIGGDINDTKEIASVRAFSQTKSIFDLYSMLTFDIIPGNHDKVDKEGIESAADLLKGPSNVNVISRSCQIDNILYIPFSSTMFDDISELYNDSCDILISHFGLSDATLSNGMSIRTKISSSDLNMFKLVLLGHYHKPQDINNVHYVGSPIPFKRDEVNEEKRFLVVNDEDFTVESVKIEGYRKYHQLIIDDIEKVDAVLAEAKDLLDKGEFVTVRKTIKEEITDSNVQVVNDYVEEHIQRGISTSMSLKDQMIKWIDIQNIPASDRDDYIKIGLNGLTYNEG